MGKSKTAAKKKQRVAKHIQVAREAKEGETKEAGDSSTSAAADKQKKKAPKKKAETHKKTPQEAHNYLVLWQASKTSTSGWKFNKNTQSWLLRHMYVGAKRD